LDGGGFGVTTLYVASPQFLTARMIKIARRADEKPSQNDERHVDRHEPIDEPFTSYVQT
jgi:hypothetical protein